MGRGGLEQPRAHAVLPRRRNALRRGCQWLTFLAFVAAILIYELVTVAVALTGVLYLLRMSRREALRRWASDVVAAVVGVLLVSALTPRAPLGTTSQKLHHAGEIGKQSLTLWADTLWPFGGLGRGVAVAILLVALAVGAWRRSRWVWAAVGAIAFVVVGYLVLVPGGGLLHAAVSRDRQPDQPDGGHRDDRAGARPGGDVAPGADRRADRGGGARRRVRREAARPLDDYTCIRGDPGARAERLRALVPHPPPARRSTCASRRRSPAPGIPTFSWRWDLSGATQVIYGDGTVHGYPIIPGDQLVCDSDAVHPQGNGLETYTAPYGHAILVDVDRGQVSGADDRAQCRATMSAWTAR